MSRIGESPTDPSRKIRPDHEMSKRWVNYTRSYWKLQSTNGWNVKQFDIEPLSSKTVLSSNHVPVLKVPAISQIVTTSLTKLSARKLTRNWREIVECSEIKGIQPESSSRNSLRVDITLSLLMQDSVVHLLKFEDSGAGTLNAGTQSHRAEEPLPALKVIYI